MQNLLGIFSDFPPITILMNIHTRFPSAPQVVVWEHTSEDENNSTTVENYPQWNKLKEYFQQYFPIDLKNFKFKDSKITNDIYFFLIPKVQVCFIENDSKDVTLSRHWSVWCQNPYYHLFFIHTKNYDEKLKQKIESWIEDMKEKKYQYCIIFVPSTPGIRKWTLNGYITKDKVYDSIRNDFPKDENFFRVPDEPKIEDFSEIIGVITEEIMVEFIKRRKRHEEEIQKFEEMKHLPGWQFLHYYMLKEGLSVTYDQFGLTRAALNIYNELKLYKTNNSMNIPKYINLNDLQISNALDTEFKNYRQAQFDLTITEFDFECYFFARQATLMLKQKIPEEAAELAIEFISHMLSKLHQNVDDKFFIHCWQYCTATVIVNECGKLAMEVLAVDRLFRILGDLYVIQRYSLSQSKKYFTKDIEMKNETKQTKIVLEVIQSEKEFENFILEISNQASACYSSGKRPRFLSRMNSEISTIRLKEEKYEEVIMTLNQSVEKYIENEWYELACDILLKLSFSQWKLGLTKDYLKSYIQLMTYSKSTTIDLKNFFDSVKLINENDEIDNVSIEISEKLIDLKMKENSFEKKLGDLFHLNVDIITNYEIEFDEVTLYFANEKNEIILKKEKLKIEPFKKEIFQKKLDRIGLFQLKHIEFKIGKIHFILKKKCEIKIFPAFPIIKINPSPYCLIVSKDQIIPVEFTIKGILFHPKLMLKSKTGLIIYEKEPEIQNEIENTSFKLNIKVRANSMINCKHNIDFTLISYGKNKPQIEQTFEFNFYIPLTFTTFTKNFKNSNFIQYKLKSNLNVPLKIQNAKLHQNQKEIEKKNQIFVSASKSIKFKNKNLLPDEIVYLNFKVSEYSNQCDLLLKLSVETQKLFYKIDTELKNRNIKYQIDIKLSNEFQVGKFQMMDISFQSMNEKDNYVICEIDSNENWMINGTKKKKLNFKNNEKKIELKVLIAPIVAGFIAIPKINLNGVSNDEIDFIFENNRILVIPENETSLGACYLDFK